MFVSKFEYSENIVNLKLLKLVKLTKTSLFLFGQIINNSFKKFIMIKKTMTTILLLLVAFIGNAQQSIVASGGDASGIRGSSSYSIGQSSYDTTTFGTISIAEGVQHAYEIQEIDEQKIEVNFNMKLAVYPNPTVDVVTLEIENFDKDISYQLVTLSGKILSTETITEKNTSIAMNNFAQGTFFLKVISKQQTIKTFKIIKN